MLAEEYLREGKLDEALQTLQDRVRKEPSNAKWRIFLFQLLAIQGEWERALTQINVLADLDKEIWPMVYSYRQAIACETFRREIFAGTRIPLLFGEPEQWMALLMEALRLEHQQQFTQAGELRAQAFELAPAIAGQIDGQDFAWIADADTRMGPVLEAMVDGQYYWIPWQRIHKLNITAPADLRDFVWLPAQFIWANGGEAFGFIPARYPGSEKSPDSALQLCRKTEWLAIADDLYHGLGQRLLSTDQNEYPLLDVRSVTLSLDS